MAAEKKKLGRGLSALLGDSEIDYAKLDKVKTAKPVAVDLLHPGKYQPRRHMDDLAIASLAESIREKGVLQPLLVRRHPDDPNAFEIIAGERRWRAAQLAKVHEVPVIIKDFDDQTTLEVAVIENVQRENLSPIEEAYAFQQLMDEFEHTQEDVSHLVGKSRSHVANTLRLLSLDRSIRDLVEIGDLTAGHARTLIGVDDPVGKAQQIIDKDLSVREAERLAKRASSSPSKARTPAKPQKDVDTIALERDLSNALGLAVSIDGHGEKGSVRIAYDTLDQLDDLILVLRQSQVSRENVSNSESTPPPTSATATPALSVSLKPKTV